MHSAAAISRAASRDGDAAMAPLAVSLQRALPAETILWCRSQKQRQGGIAGFSTQVTPVDRRFYAAGNQHVWQVTAGCLRRGFCVSW